MDVIIHTSKIRWGYPSDRQQPKAFRVQSGRSSNSYFFDIVLMRGPNFPHMPNEINVEHLLDGSVTGTYYIKVSAIHYDDTEVAASEFTINVVEPTDDVIAPIVSVY